MRQIVVNRIITPDGTELFSRHRHDYVSYTDKNGQHYSVDGGTDYLRRGFDKEDYTEASLYLDDDFEEIRKYYCRGGRGKDGKQPLKWTPLCEMSTEWLESCIQYNIEMGVTENILYQKELDYRTENN